MTSLFSLIHPKVHPSAVLTLTVTKEDALTLVDFLNKSITGGNESQFVVLQLLQELEMILEATSELERIWPVEDDLDF